MHFTVQCHPWLSDSCGVQQIHNNLGCLAVLTTLPRPLFGWGWDTPPISTPSTPVVFRSRCLRGIVLGPFSASSRTVQYQFRLRVSDCTPQLFRPGDAPALWRRQYLWLFYTCCMWNACFVTLLASCQKHTLTLFGYYIRGYNCILNASVNADLQCTSFEDEISGWPDVDPLVVELPLCCKCM